MPEVPPRPEEPPAPKQEKREHNKVEFSAEQIQVLKDLMERLEVEISGPRSTMAHALSALNTVAVALRHENTHVAAELLAQAIKMLELMRSRELDMFPVLLARLTPGDYGILIGSVPAVGPKEQ